MRSSTRCTRVSVKTRLANPIGFTTREVDGMVRAVVVGAQDGRQACEVDESDVVKIEDEHSGAIEVNAVERAQQLPDGGEVKVSPPSERAAPSQSASRSGSAAQPVATGRAIRLRAGS
jgi:hypothetical protein